MQNTIEGRYIGCVQHFILTRFNLYLWNKDKEGKKVRSREWLEHRFGLFEQFCLPSIKNQTCQNFEWIVLFDSTTPTKFKERVKEWQKECLQLIPVYVDPKDGQHFAQIFREEVVRRFKGSRVQEFKGSSCSNQELENERISLANTDDTNYTDKCFKRVLTTYLDNDDALNVRFVEDLQNRVQSLPNGTFIYYTDGYQYFTDHHYLMRIHYPRNHFVSVVESGNPATVKTIYGYGSHYYIDRIKDAKIEYINEVPMWCQVVHEKNMGNDAYFLGARMTKENDSQNENTLVKDFGLQVAVKSGIGLYLFRFLPRYCKTFIRRCGYYISRNRFK